MRLKVFVRALRVDAEVGLYAHEHGRRQPLIVDVEVELDVAAVDRLRDTLDYDRIVRSAVAIAQAGHLDLVETFAARLAAACLAEPNVARVRVRVEKPEAVPSAAAAGVEVTLERA